MAEKQMAQALEDEATIVTRDHHSAAARVPTSSSQLLRGRCRIWWVAVKELRLSEAKCIYNPTIAGTLNPVKIVLRSLGAYNWVERVATGGVALPLNLQVAFEKTGRADCRGLSTRTILSKLNPMP